MSKIGTKNIEKIFQKVSKNIEMQQSALKKLRKTEKMRNNVRNLVINSTIHGLPNLFKTERPLFKFMWLIFFLISASFGLFMVITNVFDYLEFEVVTKYQIINESPMIFPTITFYNLNKLQTNYSLDDIFIFCSFNDEDCYPKDFEIKEDSYKTVYQFNTGRNSSHYSVGLKRQSMAGSINGLKIALFAGLPRESTENRYYQSNGFHVTIHNSSVDPEYVEGFSHSGIKIPVGFRTYLIADRVFINKLEYPYNECLKDLSKIDSFDSNVFRFMINSTQYSYRQKDCFDYCIAQEMMRKCNLTGPLDRYDIIWNRYWTKQLHGCLYSTYVEFIKNLKENCSNDCPLECHSNTFQLTISSTNFPNYEFSKKLANDSKIINKYPADYKITQKDLEESLISFEVYYNDMTYIRITELPKGKMIDLVANVGGILGLFIGISFLSFIEILEILLEICLIIFEKH